MINIEFAELMKIVAPLLVLQLGLVIYCLIDVSRKGVRNLNVIGWVLIILFINTLGALAYLLIGRGTGEHAED